MSTLAEELRLKFYKDTDHPYRLFESKVNDILEPSMTLLDAGCGRTAPVLKTYIGRAKRLIGVEMVEFSGVPPEIETYHTDLAHIPLPNNCVDIIMSRSVFEHLQKPEEVYLEMARILKPGGTIVFLTANMWDYGTLIARMVPNQFHARIVKTVEGRPEEDTFPTAYKTNTRKDVERLARISGLQIDSFTYHNQYPNYLLFNAFLFLIGVAYERITTNFYFLRKLRGWIMVSVSKPDKV